MIDERFPQWDIDVEKGTIYSLYHKRYVGSADKLGYIRVKKQKNYKCNFLHQYIWMVANGSDIPEGYEIHHIDRNPSNNSIYNLELVEKTEHRKEHHKGKKLSDKHRKIISENNKTRIIRDDTRKLISEIQLNNPSKSKKVAQYTLDGELVKVWESTNECGRNGFNQGNVSACCRGERNTHKGFIWKYLNEETN